MEINMQRLFWIEDLAKKANPGPWKNVASHPHLIVTDKNEQLLENWPIGEVESYNDAAYIASVSPDVILTLIAGIFELQSQIGILKNNNNTLKYQNQRVARNNLNLRSKNANLKKEVEWLANNLENMCKNIDCLYCPIDNYEKCNETNDNWRQAAVRAINKTSTR